MAVERSVPQPLAIIGGTVVNAEKWAKDNGAWLAKLIDGHRNYLVAAKVDTYQAAYDGFLESVNLREKSRGDDVNHKLMPNYAQLIIDTPVDYLTGKPIIWTVYDPELPTEPKDEAEAAKETPEVKARRALVEAYRDDLIKILRSEDAQRTLAEQLRQGSIASYSGVIAWVNDKGQIDYDEYPIQELIPVYDVRGRLLMVVRQYPYEVVEETDNGAVTLPRTRVEVYDDKYTTYYLSDETGSSYELDAEEALTGNPIEHKAGRIPVSIFVNGTPASYATRQKKAGVSDLGNGVLTLLENYAHLVSDKANTVDRLLDQYLLFVGCDIDEGEVKLMRKARAISLKGDKNTADASFIAPTQEDTAVENHAKRLKEDIHATTFTPKLDDIEGATATEIKMKYANLDIKAGKKELYFISAVKQFVTILTDLLNARRLVDAGVTKTWDVLTGQAKPPKSVELYNPDWVAFTFNRNLPQNHKEIADIVKLLVGVVPDAYLYELLWFIDDPVAALEEMKAQKEAERADEAEMAAALGVRAMGLGADGAPFGE